MDKRDKAEYINRYERRLKLFGYSPATLGWGKGGRQEVRFSVLAQPIIENPDSTVLDVGCGFADFYSFLKNHGWNGSYCGIDIVPGLLKIAKERFPHLDLLELDITSQELISDRYDYVVGSGLFNSKLRFQNNLQYIQQVLNNMLSLSRIAVCVDFMSSYVDFQHKQSWHTDPGWVFAIATKMSRRIALRHDYMPYEFVLFIFRNDSISPSNIFQSFDYEVNAVED
ncbi:MAG: class I SAM-dependent methyltransferase [Cyanobacteriota bacterium]|nr:class I SAM-dependent methyltransferase [Cyanobacteriota bacterium]